MSWCMATASRAGCCVAAPAEAHPPIVTGCCAGPQGSSSICAGECCDGQCITDVSGSAQCCPFGTEYCGGQCCGADSASVCVPDYEGDQDVCCAHSSFERSYSRRSAATRHYGVASAYRRVVSWSRLLELIENSFTPAVASDTSGLPLKSRRCSVLFSDMRLTGLSPANVRQP